MTRTQEIDLMIETQAIRESYREDLWELNKQELVNFMYGQSAEPITYWNRQDKASIIETILEDVDNYNELDELAGR